MSLQGKNLRPFLVKVELHSNEKTPAAAVDVQDDELANEPTPQSGKITRTRWSTHETTTLCKSWENVVTDNYVGANQTCTQYWIKVTNCYNEMRGESIPRSLCQCKNHFSKVSKTVANFSKAFHRALAIKESGWNDDDVIKKAHSIYEAEEGKCFMLMDTWQILRQIPKWWSHYVEKNQNSTSSGSKRSRTNEGGDYSNSSSNTETPSSVYPIRPPGMETTKKEGKRAIKETQNEVANDTTHMLPEFDEKFDRYMKLSYMRLEEDKKNRLLRQWEILMKKENKSPEEEEDCTKLYRELFK